jgi:hypothetical protein
LHAVVVTGADQVYGVTRTASDETEWQSIAHEKAMRALAARPVVPVDVDEVRSLNSASGAGTSTPRARPARYASRTSGSSSTEGS